MSGIVMGAKHHNADALSRMPQESTQDCSGSRLDDEHPAALTGVLLDGGRESQAEPFHLLARHLTVA